MFEVPGVSVAGGGAAVAVCPVERSRARVASRAVDAMRALVDELAVCDSWLAEDRGSALNDLDRIEGLVAAARGRLLVAERDAGTSMRPGDASFEAAQARRSRAGWAGAARQVRQAEALRSMPVLADAVSSGTLPVSHLDAVARASAAASPAISELLTSAAGQSTVLALARAHDAPAFARSLTGWVAAHDPAALEQGHEVQRRARFLHLSHQSDGTFVRGRLDSMAGHRLQLALEATGQEPGEDRTPEQARADALVALADRALSAPATLSGTSQRPHLSVLVDAETVAAVQRRQRGAHADGAGGPGGAGGAGGGLRAHDAGEGAGCLAGVHPAFQPADEDAVAPATLEDGTPVPSSELARLLCDSELTRMVLTAESVPLDLGRTVRTYTGAQRRAVVARDRHCAWPSCSTPARWGEVHHIRWWDRDDGATSVDNGVLLCSFHHHEVHRRDLTIERHTSPPRRSPRARSRSGSDDVGGRPPTRTGLGTAPGPAITGGPAPGPRTPARYTFRTADGRVLAEPP
ncbi:hypothetical protein Cch01nite_22340 [Cellulomonas chitinilytica]|uniref:HNH nuclease domain-containing protein n=1 Tax=Cellulomonas chitinilytica TaxID=398759 RepID=A0A919P3D1_9CELL|nr:HNH endonuclease signature motif containing protein [Cellulomonas chitinilytica]GIG21510.1 hypothetical protein Cch01nite_22340 [Cellulomonas chitinilytica]